MSLNELEGGSDDFEPYEFGTPAKEVEELGLTGVPPRCRAPFLSAFSRDVLTTYISLARDN